MSNVSAGVVTNRRRRIISIAGQETNKGDRIIEMFFTSLTQKARQ